MRLANKAGCGGLLALLLAACAHAVAPGTGGSGGGAAKPPMRPEGCTDSSPCAPGSVCHNGACAKGCNVDTDCASTEFCATDLGQICQPAQIAACPKTPCASTQVCANGMCATQTGMPCGPAPFNPNADGCSKDQVCLGQVEVNGTMVQAKQCYTLPACAPDGTCAGGDEGGFCAAQALQGKAAVCAPGVCLTGSDCPTGAACVHVKSTGDAYGHCSDGNSGSLCETGADCSGGSCVVTTPGFLGACQ